MPLTQQVPPIEGGCHYALQVAVSCHGPGPFPSDSPILARIRDYEGSAVVAMLSTTAGSLYLVDDQTIELQLAAATTTLLSNTSALIDFMAGYEDPDPIGIALRLPVIPTGDAVLRSNTAVVMSLYDVSLSRCAARRGTMQATSSSALAASNTITGFVSRGAALDARLTALGA